VACCGLRPKAEALERSAKRGAGVRHRPPENTSSQQWELFCWAESGPRRRDDGLEPEGRNRPVACCGLRPKAEALERSAKRGAGVRHRPPETTSSQQWELFFYGWIVMGTLAFSCSVSTGTLSPRIVCPSPYFARCQVCPSPPQQRSCVPVAVFREMPSVPITTPAALVCARRHLCGTRMHAATLSHGT